MMPENQTQTFTVCKVNILTDNSVTYNMIDDTESQTILLKKIKNREINKDRIPEDKDCKRSFLLCLLDKKERKMLEQKDEDFMETFRSGEQADVPEAEWNSSESNLKFSRSF